MREVGCSLESSQRLRKSSLRGFELFGLTEHGREAVDARHHHRYERLVSVLGAQYSV
jgi:hypothetical protein